jgi:hypothetical protein
MRHLGALLIVMLTTGCAIGQKYTFNYKPASMPNVGGGSTVVLLQPADMRPYITSGEEPVTFVGEMRNGYGMPFNVTTANDQAFAEVVEEIAARDLTASGFNVVRGGKERPEELPTILRAKNAAKGLYIVIRELNANTYTNIDVEWNLDGAVYDASGKVVKTNTTSGKTELTGSFMNPVKASKQKVPEFVYQKVHELLSGLTDALR